MDAKSNVTPEQRLVITLDAERMAHTFFLHLDESNYEPLIALFTPEGVWHRQGKELRGHGMMREAMQARPKGHTTRHLVSNLLVDIVDQDHAVSSFYLTVYGATADGTSKDPLPIGLPNIVGVYKQKLARTGGGWRVTEMSARTTFKK
jgi:hypothetical protein